MIKPKIGDKFYLVKKGRRVAYGDAFDCEVTKVGIKYFTVNYSTDPSFVYSVQFCIDNRRQKTDFTADCYLFDSKQHYDDHEEALRWRQKFNKTFDHWGEDKYTLDQYREAAKILNIEIEGGS